MTDCHVAIDSAGDAVAVWSYETEFEFEPVWAAYRPAGGAWQAPVQLAPATNSSPSPAVAIDSRGDAAAVWVGSSFKIQGSYKPAGSDWHEPKSAAETEDLSQGDAAGSDPHVAVDAQGDASAVWSIGIGEHDVVQVASRPAGGPWQTAVDLSEASESAYVPDVAMDSAGAALALWDIHSGEHWIVQAAARPSAGEWQAPVDLSSASEDAYQPQMALNPEGVAVAVWELDSSGSWTVQGAVKPAGAGWQTPIAVSEATSQGELFPEVTIDAQGDAVATWELYNGASYLIQAAGYQAAGPQLRSLTIPPNATVGEPVAFSISPLDAWAALGTTKWTFGDGSSATGTNVKHAYAAAGVYPVTLTGEDTLGNMSTTSGTITIVPAPATGPEGSSPGPGTPVLDHGAPKPPPAVSNAFRIVRIRTSRDGRIVLTLKVPDGGLLSASARIAAAIRASAGGKSTPIAFYGKGSARTSKATAVTLTITPRRAALSALRRSGRLRLLLMVTFRPTGGTPRTDTKTVTLTRR